MLYRPVLTATVPLYVEVLTAVLNYSSEQAIHQFPMDHSTFIFRVKQFLTFGKPTSSALTNF
jgi:hypothetical protein